MRRSQTRVNQSSETTEVANASRCGKGSLPPSIMAKPSRTISRRQVRDLGTGSAYFGIRSSTFLQGFVPLSLTATQVSIGKVIGSDHQMNHGLPEYTAVPVEVAPDFLPVIVGSKIVTGPKML